MSINVKEIVKRWMRKRGYQGLYNDVECGCSIDELFPCASYQCGDCVPAYEFDCDECIRENCTKRSEAGLFYHPDKDYCKPIHPVRLGE